MIFQDELRRLELARADLARARAGPAGWSDQLRRRFDANRMEALTDAGARLATALADAQQKFEAAERLISG